MKRAAREALEGSLGTFEELGARLWAGKARAELARIGGRRPTTGDLTPTERRIAELVAEGRTDKEIAGGRFRDVEDGRHPALTHLPQGRGAIAHRARRVAEERRRRFEEVGVFRLSPLLGDPRLATRRR